MFNSQNNVLVRAAILEKLQMFDCVLSNNKSNIFRIEIQIEIQSFYAFFQENFVFSYRRFFEHFYRSLGSSKN